MKIISPVLLAAIAGRFAACPASAHVGGLKSGSYVAAPQNQNVPPQQAAPETTFDFGKSVKGAPLRAYILGNGTNTTLIFGDFHGNERSVPGVVEELRAYLKENTDKWPDCRVILVPYANPDGWEARTRVNADGVDINRNFPGTWKPVCSVTRFNPGPTEASEPETRAIMRLVDLCNPAKVVSIHQPFKMLSWTGARGLRLAKLMHERNRYRVTDDVGYATPGAFGDYCARRNIATVTLELPDRNVSSCWKQNQDALLAAINLR